MTATAPDPLLVDLERLEGVASRPIIGRGIAYFREHRVIELEHDERRIWSRVQGSDPDAAYACSVAIVDGELHTDCDCPFDWEPTCKHAVATLLAYAAARPASADELSGAAGRAVDDRRRRGRTEVEVTLVAGFADFGTWEARSVKPCVGRPGTRTYRVEIRSLTERTNHCSCPDFAINRLGTCKHVEAVLHRARRRRKRCRERPALVHLDWDAPGAPQIRLTRGAAEPSPELAGVLADTFDVDGWFGHPLPEAFFELERRVRGLDGLLIGEDAADHARLLADQAARALRGERIRERILGSGGRLPGIDARLYPYQIEGVAFLASRGRALLADDMGLGKTLQAIAASVWLMREDQARRALVVCPASLKQQWAREIERFAGLDCQVIEGPARTRGVQYRRRAPFTIVNYELVLRDLSVINETLAPDLLILDEAQRIKNWRTKTAGCIGAIASRHAFILTGTPLENRLEDLHSLMQRVDPRALGPLWRFIPEFHITGERGQVVAYRNLGDLRRRIAPHMLRRDRRLVRDQLPPRVEQRLDVPMSESQQELHDSALAAATMLARIMKRRALTPAEEQRLLAALQTARMACDAAGLVDGETEGSPKLDELARLLEELCLEGGRKVVVFSQWERMTAMAAQVCRRLGIGCERLHGGVPSRARGPLLDRFTGDDRIQVLLSTDAGGVGLNLQAASALINLDMPWNPAVLEQRIARVHRLGQTESVQVVLLLSADSYEQRVATRLETKRELFDAVVDPEATGEVVGLTRSALEWLAETLDEPAPRSGEQAPEEPEVREAEPTDPAVPAPKAQSESDAALCARVEAIQQRFAGRVERILATTGALVVVLAGCDDADHAAADALSGDVAVIVLDARSAAAFERLGSASPLAGARELAAGPPPDPRAFERRLHAASLLIEQGCAVEAVGVIATAMLARLASRSGRRPPARGDAAVWLFAEALPAGQVSGDEAAAAARALALDGAAEVPVGLAGELLADARQMGGR